MERSDPSKFPTLLLLVASLASLCGCDTTSALAGRVLLPTMPTLPPDHPGAIFETHVAFTNDDPFGEQDGTYIFASGGTVASGRDGRTTPIFPVAADSAAVIDGGWVWHLETVAGHGGPTASALVAATAGQPCQALPPDLFTPGVFPVLPPATSDPACVLRRVHQLVRSFAPGVRLPPVDITTTLIPFGTSAQKIWYEASPDTLRLHYIHRLGASGNLLLDDTWELVGHELTHALSSTGLMPWGSYRSYADDPGLPRHKAYKFREEQRAFTLEACFSTVTTGRDTRKTLAVNSDFAANDLQLQGGALKSAITDESLPIDAQAQRAFVESYKALNGGSGDFSGSNPQQVAALFGLCHGIAIDRGTGLWTPAPVIEP